MRSLNRAVLGLGVVLAAAALSLFLRSRGDVRSERDRLGEARPLEGSLAPLAEEFNRSLDRARLLAVLSPACPVCLAGVGTIRQELLGADDQLAVLVVWMEALPFDITRNPARRVELLAGDPRVTQFYDARQVSGRAVSELVGWPAGSVAWDVYLFFEAGVSWGESPPEPVAWFHQRHEADPAHFRTGPELAEALRVTADGLSQ